jgi:hypothetical protein
VGGCGSDSCGSEYGLVVDCCEHADFIKGGEFID